MLERLIDVAVIGGGPAGLAAAIAAAEGGTGTVVLFDRQKELGGILPQCIHNGFGLRYFKQELTGPEYAQRFIERLPDYPQIEVKKETMVLELTADRQLITTGARDGLMGYRAKAVVLAMGCRERPRGAVNIPGTRPAGVFTAGTIQRLMNIDGLRPGERAVILGSGDIGLIMARRLTLEGIKVAAVLELLPYSCGLTRNVVQCLDDFEIPLYLNHTVVEIYGEKRVTGVKAAPVDRERRPLLEQSFDLDCDTLVLSVGLIPENELSRMAGIQIAAATSGPVIDSHCQTSIPGIFACGNVAHVHDLVDDVSEEARVAGAAAAAFIRGGDWSGTATPKIVIRPGRNIRSVTPQAIIPGEPAVLYIRAAFPERNVTVKTGGVAAGHRIVTPGETIRITIRPEQIDPAGDFLEVAIVKGDETSA
jgi:NADPH-dependent 2,4-dienoyl-CoA reductase/sulfur reductase-like enzyme